MRQKTYKRRNLSGSRKKSKNAKNFKKAKIFVPQFYKVEERSQAQDEIEAYDGDKHTQTNENVDYLRALVINRDKKRAANRREEARKK